MDSILSLPVSIRRITKSFVISKLSQFIPLLLKKDESKLLKKLSILPPIKIYSNTCVFMYHVV